MRKFSLFLWGLAAAFVFGASSADAVTVDLATEGDLTVTALDSSTDYTNSGAEVKTLTVNLAANATYNGTISGKVRLVYESGGKVLTLGGDNSHTGGTEIRQGRITVMTSTALGSGDVAITASASSSTAGSVAFGAENLTLANAFTVSGANPGRVKDMRCTFYSDMKTSTVSGKVSVAQGGGVAITTQYATPNYDVNFYFKGGIDAPGGTVNAAGIRKTTIVFDSDVACEYLDGWHDSYVVLSFPAGHHHDIKRMRCQYTNISLAGTNDMGADTVFFWDGKMEEDGRSMISLKGNQTINCITGTVCTVAKGQNISGSADVTLTLRAQHSGDAWMKFAAGETADGQGTVTPLNLCYDPLDASYVQSFHARAHRLSGNITVKGGTFKVTDGAAFRDVPKIDVQGGTFLIDSQATNALAGVTELSIAAGATFDSTAAADHPLSNTIKLTLAGATSLLKLKVGDNLNLTELWVGGTRLAGGVYAHEAQGTAKALAGLTGGTLNVAHWPGEPIEITDATWTAGGADNSLATAGNWNKAVNTTDESLNATFAAAGEIAELAASADLLGIVFSAANPSGFRFTALQSDNVLSLGFGGVVASPRETSAPREFVFDAPVKAMSDQVWSLGTNDTLVLRRPLLGYNAATAISFSGTAGSLVAFDAESPDYAATLSFTNTRVQVGAPAYAFGSSAQQVNFISADVKSAPDENHAYLTITNGTTIACPMFFSCDAALASMRFGANTTNSLGKVTYKYLVKQNNTATTYAEPGSHTVFREGVAASSVVTTYKGLSGVGEQPVIEFLKKSDNGAHTWFHNLHMIARAGGWTAYAFNLNDKTYFDAYADDVLLFTTPHVAHVVGITSDSTLNVHTTKQRLGRLGGGGTVTGEAGSRVVYWTSNDLYTCASKFEGAVSFEMEQGRVNLTGLSGSSGSFTVTNGVVTVAATAGWTNLSTVAVSKTGTLNVTASGNFAPTATWRLGGGTVNLASGVRAKAAALYLDGAETPAPDGVYGSAEAASARPGINVSDRFAGPGVLRVGNLGLTLIVR